MSADAVHPVAAAGGPGRPPHRHDRSTSRPGGTVALRYRCDVHVTERM
jgi:hypothetical protein